MNPLDYIMISFVIIFMIKGLIQSAPKAFIAFVFLALAFFIAVIFAPEISLVISEIWPETADASFFLAYLFLFIAVYSLTSLLGWFVSRLFEKKEKKAGLIIGGGFAGVLEGVAWCYVLLGILEFQPFFSLSDTFVIDSFFFSYIEKSIPVF